MNYQLLNCVYPSSFETHSPFLQGCSIQGSKRNEVANSHDSPPNPKLF